MNDLVIIAEDPIPPFIVTVGIRGPEGLPGIGIKGYWDMSSGETVLPLPLDATLSALQGAEPTFTDLLVLTEDYQKGQFSIAGVAKKYGAAASSFDEVIDLNAGTTTVDVDFTLPQLVFSTSGAYQEIAKIHLFSLATTEYVSLQFRISQYEVGPNPHQLVLSTTAEYENAVTSVTASVPGIVSATIVFDSDAGTIAFNVDGSSQSLVSDAFTPGDYLVFMQGLDRVGFTSGLPNQGDPSNAGKSIGMQFSVTQDGQAELPDGAAPGDVFQVQAPGGIYGGIPFSTDDLAIVRLDGVSVTRIPADGMSAAEVAAAIAAIPDLGISDVTGLEDALDLKLNASDFNEHWRGRFVDLPALEAAIPVGNNGDNATVGVDGSAHEYIWDGSAWVASGDVSLSTTDALVEGSLNLYFTDGRALGAVSSELDLKQALNANLTAESGLTGAADKISYFTGLGAKALADFKAFGRTLAALVGVADLGPVMHTATAKTTPVDADEIGVFDSAASWALKVLTFANLWVWIKGKADLIYSSRVRTPVALVSVSGTLTIDCSVTEVHKTVTLFENIGTWTFTNRPAAGSFIKIFVRIQQDAATARTVVSPASASSTAGGVWIQSPTLASVEMLEMHVGNTTVELFPSGVYQ